MTNFLFTKEEAKDLFSDEITVSRQKELLKKADDRFSYIMKVIGEVIGRKFDWFDFDNESGSNGNPIRGYFDKDSYRHEINFVGEYQKTKNKDFLNYDDVFPTAWLWTDFEDDLKKEVNAYEVNEKQKADDLAFKKNQKKQEIQNIAEKLPVISKGIYSKVPKEMREIFNFKSPDKIYAESIRKNNKELQDVEKMLEQKKEFLRNTLTEEELATIEFKTPEQILERMKATQVKSTKKNKP